MRAKTKEPENVLLTYRVRKNSSRRWNDYCQRTGFSRKKRETSNKSEQRKWQQQKKGETLFLFCCTPCALNLSFALSAMPAHRFKCQQVKSNCLLIASYSEKPINIRSLSFLFPLLNFGIGRTQNRNNAIDGPNVYWTNKNKLIRNYRFVFKINARQL